MRKLTIGKRTFDVPESFAECKPEAISKILFAQHLLRMHEEVDDEEMILDSKMNIANAIMTGMKRVFRKLTVEQHLQVFGLVRWAFTAKVTEKPFDFFEHDGERYFLPAAQYADTSSIEWALLNIYYLAYTNPNTDGAARTPFFYKIIAILCRPERADVAEFRKDAKSWNGDVREVFNDIDSVGRSGILERVDFGTLLAVFQYWEEMNNAFVKRNKELFEAGDEQLFLNGEGCLSTLEDIAEMGTLGDLDKVHGTNVANVFMFMRHKNLKTKAAERKNRRTDA